MLATKDELAREHARAPRRRRLVSTVAASVWHEAAVAPSTRLLSLAGSLLLSVTGASSNATFRRWMHVHMQSAPLRLLTRLTRNVEGGVRISSREVVVDVASGLTAVVFRPAAPPPPGRRYPVFLFLHGGGFAIGDPNEAIFYRFCRFFAASGFVVVSPAYRLAPEHPFPCGLEDAVRTLRFIGRESASEAKSESESGSKSELGSKSKSKSGSSESAPASESALPWGDAGCVVVGGDSAGGNLALVLATLVRDGLDAALQPLDLSRSVRVRHVVLLYPAMMLPHPTASAVGLHSALMLPRWLCDFFLESYLPDVATRQALLREDRRVCPLHAGMHALPPVTLVSGSRDPFRDECVVLERELMAAGAMCAHHQFQDVAHGFATQFDATTGICCQVVLKELKDALHLP